MKNFISLIRYALKSRHYKLNQQLLLEKEAELIKGADEYYQNTIGNQHLRNKPFSTLFETPELLENFGALLSGLKLFKSAVVLDFGAGPAYTSEFLMRMGCRVIATDVSERVLRYAAEKVKLDPRNVENGDFDWVVYSDNELPGISDESVDRIVVVDCFHHVANIQATLKCFARILRPGGIIGFSEAGYNHSQDPNTQEEMKQFGTLENDIILEDIWAKAQQVGFQQLWIKPLIPQSYSLDISQYRSAKFGFFPKSIHLWLAKRFQSHIIFFLKKSGQEQRDSRGIEGLTAEIELFLDKDFKTFRADQEIKFSCKVINTGTAIWLHKSWQDLGTVRLGIHWLNGMGTIENYDYIRFDLPHDLLPGDAIIFDDVLMLPPRAGKQTLVWDLVSEGICWFSRINACQPKIVDFFLS